MQGHYFDRQALDGLLQKVGSPTDCRQMGTSEIVVGSRSTRKLKRPGGSASSTSGLPNNSGRIISGPLPRTALLDLT
jgi:hypothetical protein